MNSAEFWMAMTFLFVLFISFIPLKKFLSAWGQKRADKIRQELDRAHRLLHTAKELFNQSEEHLHNKDQAARHIINQEIRDSNDLLYQTHLACAEEYMAKQQELTDRLTLIQKQADEELNQKIMDIVLSLTAHQIKQKIKISRRKQTLMQQDVDLFLSALDGHKDTLKEVIK